MIRERLEFAPGDRLEARDLADEQAREAALHGLHVRALHRVAGIAVGFAVAASADRRAVLVGAGLAYDHCGRPLVLGASARIPLPPDAADGDHRLGAATMDGRPRWCWLEARSSTSAVLVARVAVQAARVQGNPDPAGRPLALAAPRIAGGFVTVLPSEFVFSTITVDTSRAGFITTPCYFAQPVDADAGTGFAPGALEPVLSIREERPQRFDLDVRRLGPRTTAGIPVPVAWVGVEQARPVAGPPPSEASQPQWCR
jgi:hypothetical protein